MFATWSEFVNSFSGYIGAFGSAILRRKKRVSIKDIGKAGLVQVYYFYHLREIRSRDMFFASLPFRFISTKKSEPSYVVSDCMTAAYFS